MGIKEEHSTLDKAIVLATVASTPEHWNAIVLSVSQTKADGLTTLSHAITSPEGHRDYVEPSQELYDLTRQLSLLFDRYGKPWTSVKYSIQVLNGSDIDFQANYTY